MDLADWLRSLGLERYEVAFREGRNCYFNANLWKHCALRIETDTAAFAFTYIAMRRLRAQAPAQWRKRADDHDHTHRD
jgi:hypothetical protein